VLIADEDDDVSIRGLDQLQSCPGALDALFHPSRGTVPGGWLQDLLIAGAGLSQLRGFLGSA